MDNTVFFDDLDIYEHIDWQRGPNTRGGLNIIYKCLAVIITCVWTTLHLNVPALEDGFWKRSGRKIKWMIVMIIFPELVFGLAILQLKNATDDYMEMAKLEDSLRPLGWCIHPGKASRRIHRILSANVGEKLTRFLGLERLFKRLNRPIDRPVTQNIDPLTETPTPAPESIQLTVLDKDGSPDTDVELGLRREEDVSHVLKQETKPASDTEPVLPQDIPLPPTPPPESESTQNNDDTSNPPSFLERSEEDPRIPKEFRCKNHPECTQWTLTHSIFANMGGIFEPQLQKPLRTSAFIQSPEMRENLRHFRISKKEILDKGKADMFVRLLWGYEALSLWVEIIARLTPTKKVGRLPIHPLEWSAAAFALFTLVMIIMQVGKPQSITCPILLTLERSEVGALPTIPIESSGTSIGRIMWPSFKKKRPSPVNLSTGSVVKQNVANDYVNIDNRGNDAFYNAVAISSACFGGLHLLALRYSFPSLNEQMIWLLGCCYGTILPVAIVGLVTIAHRRTRNLERSFTEQCSRHNIPHSDAWSGKTRETLDTFLDNSLGSRETTTLNAAQTRRLRGTANALDRIYADSFYNRYILPFFKLCFVVGLILARVATIVISFETFRSAPVGIYVETWTRFLPTVK